MSPEKKAWGPVFLIDTNPARLRESGAHPRSLTSRAKGLSDEGRSLRKLPLHSMALTEHTGSGQCGTGLGEAGDFYVSEMPNEPRTA